MGSRRIWWRAIARAMLVAILVCGVVLSITTALAVSISSFGAWFEWYHSRDISSTTCETRQWRLSAWDSSLSLRYDYDRSAGFDTIDQHESKCEQPAVVVAGVLVILPWALLRRTSGAHRSRGKRWPADRRTRLGTFLRNLTKACRQLVLATCVAVGSIVGGLSLLRCTIDVSSWAGLYAWDNECRVRNDSRIELAWSNESWHGVGNVSEALSEQPQSEIRGVVGVAFLSYPHETGAGLALAPWIPPLILIPLPAYWLFAPAWRRRLRARRGLCLACGYDLRGSGGGRCPECGAGAEPVGAMQRSDRTRGDEGRTDPESQI